MKKVAFFMSRRHARYKSEEIAPGGQSAASGHSKENAKTEHD